MPRPIAGRRILVVDDDPLVCDSIRRLLALDGHVVETAPSGQRALDLFVKGRFDMVLADYRMASMSGSELAKAIKALDPSQLVVMITAYPETVASSGNPLAGVDLVISKPFDLQELRHALTKLLTKA